MKKQAVRSLGASLGGNASVFSTDPDPELVGQALPFTLKTMEALIHIDPESQDLLLAACSGFTQYAYAYVELESERLKDVDYRRSAEQRRRATDLYLRGRGYCFRALDLNEPGLSSRLPNDAKNALAELKDPPMELLYWTGAAWGSAISAGRDRLEVVVDLPAVRELFEFLLERDETYGRGALHDAMISLEAVPETMGGSPERAKAHYLRAVELSGDTRVGSHLAWAWLVTIGRQDREAFEEALERALAVDLERSPNDRLANEVNRRFAEHLLDRADELFLDDSFEEDDELLEDD